jgi:hypothetical protein
MKSKIIDRINKYLCKDKLMIINKLMNLNKLWKNRKYEKIVIVFLKYSNLSIKFLLYWM